MLGQQVRAWEHHRATILFFFPTPKDSFLAQNLRVIPAKRVHFLGLNSKCLSLISFRLTWLHGASYKPGHDLSKKSKFTRKASGPATDKKTINDATHYLWPLETDVVPVNMHMLKTVNTCGVEGK